MFSAHKDMCRYLNANKFSACFSSFFILENYVHNLFFMFSGSYNAKH